MEQRNMILAFVLSMAVLLGWQLLFPPAEEPAVNAPKPSRTVEQRDTATAEGANDVSVAQSVKPSEGIVSAPPSKLPQEGIVSAPPSKLPQEGIVSAPPSKLPRESRDIGELKNDLLTLKINASGAVAGAQASKYYQDIRPGSPTVNILETQKDHARYVNAGILGQPTPKFRVDSITKEGNASVLTLRAGLTDGRAWFRRMKLAHGSYVVDIEDRITNGTGLKMYYQVVERHPNREKTRMYQYRGPIGLINEKLKEISFDDLDKKSPVIFTASGGWTGIMNRYFIAALLGGPAQTHRYYFKADGDTYQAGRIDDPAMQDASAVFHSRIYIGPKSTPVMKQQGAGLERSVDYGWFAFISKPLHDLLLWFYRYIHNFGLCIILLVIVIKILFFWPTKKSYESMAGMRKLQPEMKRLKELYGDDRQKMGQEMMGLYKKHKVNPMGGCLPVVIQIPVFFALYKVLLMSIEMRQAPFFGWIHDLSAMDPFYVLPVLMGASMLIQQRLNPTPPDPMQAKIMKFLPVIFTFMFLFFPSGLVLYWLVNNILSIAQQWYVMKQVKAI